MEDCLVFPIPRLPIPRLGRRRGNQITRGQAYFQSIASPNHFNSKVIGDRPLTQPDISRSKASPPTPRRYLTEPTNGRLRFASIERICVALLGTQRSPMT